MATSTTSTGTSGGNLEETSEEHREGRAHIGGLIAAVVAGLLGIVLVLVPAVVNLGSVWNDPFKPRQTIERVVTTTPDGKTVTKTTQKEEGSFLDRSLAEGGLLLLRFGIVVIAAFLAGAVVQRAILGRFDITLGPLSFPELKQVAAGTEKALEDLKLQLQAQKDATEDVASSTARALDDLVQTLAQLEASHDAALSLLDVDLDETRRLVETIASFLTGLTGESGSG